MGLGHIITKKPILRYAAYVRTGSTGYLKSPLTPWERAIFRYAGKCVPAVFGKGAERSAPVDDAVRRVVFGCSVGFGKRGR
jgi:hypothetical protein